MNIEEVTHTHTHTHTHTQWNTASHEGNVLLSLAAIGMELTDARDQVRLRNWRIIWTRTVVNPRQQED